MDVLMLSIAFLGPIIFGLILYFASKQENTNKNEEEIEEPEDKNINKTPQQKSKKLITLDVGNHWDDENDITVKITGAKISEYHATEIISDVWVKGFVIKHMDSTENFEDSWIYKEGPWFDLEFNQSKQITIELISKKNSKPVKFIVPNLNDIERIDLHSDNELQIWDKRLKAYTVIKAEKYPFFNLEVHGCSYLYNFENIKFGEVYEDDEEYFSEPSKAKLTIKIDGADVFYIKRIDGLKEINSKCFELDPEKTSTLFNNLYLKIEQTDKIIIDVKNENGFHAEFVMDQKLKDVDYIKIDLEPYTQRLEAFKYGHNYPAETVYATPDEKTEKEWQEASNNFSWIAIKELLKYVEQYFDVLNTKYKQYVYVNEWGEKIGEEKFQEAIDHFFDIVRGKIRTNNNAYRNTEECQKLKIVATKKYLVDIDNTDKYTHPCDIELYNFDNNFANKHQKEIIEKFKEVGIDYKNLASYGDIEGLIESYIEGLIEKHNEKHNKKISPIDYEKQIAIQLKDLGFNARTTKGSGDQGADVLANKDGVKFAIQCKMYSKPVGNKAVQEVNAARDYYKCDYGVVITNSSYTPAARKAANACGVILLTDKQIDKLEEFV